ncbi:MAG: putative RNA-binding protein EIF1AD [Bacillariaceae sp.]|jgi:probable RNA-binding protein EIF1AD
MAGLGRRTHYRKHLTDKVLYDLPEPKSYERIAKVVATRGGNQFDIILAGTTSTKVLAILPTKFHKLVWVKRNDYVIVETGFDDNDEDNDNAKKEELKDDQDSAVDVESKSNDNNHVDEEKETGIRFIISHILYKDQVKHLRSKQLWPENDPEFFEVDTDTRNNRNIENDTNDTNNVDRVDDTVNNDDDQQQQPNNDGDDDDDDEDGIVYNEMYEDDLNDDDLFVNTNRIARLEIDENSDGDYDASSDEEEEEGEGE